VTRSANVIQPLRIADAKKALRHVFVRDLVLAGRVGIYEREKETAQRLRINLDLAVREDAQPIDDDYAKVVCYEQIVAKVRGIVEDGHVNLVETLAERLAGICLQDPRVRTCRVRVEKLDVFADALSVGVEIERDSPFAEA
jgi:dihydroneopterin aldolase